MNAWGSAEPGYVDTAIGNLEAGLSLPGVATVELLAGALGCSPCWLAYGVGQAPPAPSAGTTGTPRARRAPGKAS